MDKASSSYHGLFCCYSTSCPSIMTVKRGGAWVMEVNDRCPSCLSLCLPHLVLSVEGVSENELTSSFSRGARKPREASFFFFPEFRTILDTGNRQKKNQSNTCITGNRDTFSFIYSFIYFLIVISPIHFFVLYSMVTQLHMHVHILF